MIPDRRVCLLLACLWLENAEKCSTDPASRYSGWRLFGEAGREACEWSGLLAPSVIARACEQGW